MPTPPITPVTFPNHYVLTLSVANTLNPLIVWRNSIDIVASAGNIPQPTDPVVVAFEGWLQGLLRNDSTIVAATLRNWSRGVQPFNAQAALWEVALALVGNAFTASGAYGALPVGSPTVGEICIRLQKSNFTTGGRFPNMFLRNSVRTLDVNSVAGGRPTLGAGGGQITFAQVNTFTNAKLSPYLTNNPLPRFCNVHYSNKHAIGPFDTAIGSITALGLTTHNTSRKSSK